MKLNCKKSPVLFYISKGNLLLLLAFILHSCTTNQNKNDFRVPDLKVLNELSPVYNPVNSIDTPFNLDNPKQHLIIEARFMPRDSIKRYKLDTLKFYHANNYMYQEQGYSWLFGGIGYASQTDRNKDGIEKEIYTQVNSKLSISPYFKRKDGVSQENGDYFIPLNTDIIASARKNDSVLYALGHPITKKLRIKDSYYKINERDSVPVKNYMDKIDSTKLIYVRFSVRKIKQK